MINNQIFIYSLNNLSGFTPRVSSAHLRDIAPGSTHSHVAAVANRWQRVGDLTGWTFESHISRPLPLCAIW